MTSPISEWLKIISYQNAEAAWKGLPITSTHHTNVHVFIIAFTAHDIQLEVNIK